ncbi:MAG: mandelate racemase [Burkholderiales bacterium]|nr:MAG: mandelate racemase [Burkholderiales bacterium]
MSVHAETPLRIAELRTAERPVRLRMPFRFGVVTMTEAPQLFVQARIELADGGGAWGVAASLLAPKWFDKNPALDNERNFAQLRESVDRAAQAYLSAGSAATAFGHFAAHYQALLDAARSAGENALVASFGQAMVDAAVLDALGRALGLSFYQMVRANVPGIRAVPLAPDLAGFELAAWLGSLRPAERIHARHTVGLVDAIRGHPGLTGDGLPESLEEVVAGYRHRYYKLKVGGALEADLARLLEIASVLDAGAGDYRVTLDGNEQYEDVEQVVALWQAIEAHPALRRLAAATLFIEQPIRRDRALARDVGALSALRPVIIDESDDRLDAFVQALALGYRGVSSKLCKGLYKSLLNGARCARHAADAGAGAGAWLMSGEDLTNQAGIAVQQDIALVNLLGITHVERNGHHYVNGMTGVDPAEQAAFARAHPDLYESAGGVTRVRIRDGALEIGSLDCAGFASAVLPHLDSTHDSAHDAP